MRSKRLVLILTCILAALVVIYVVHRHRGAEPTAEAPLPLPTVSVATAHSGFIANQLTVAGIFQAFQEIDVHGKVSGYIRHIYVDIGDRVRQGQTLAVLEVPELQAQVAGAQAGISQTQQNIIRLQNEGSTRAGRLCCRPRELCSAEASLGSATRTGCSAGTRRRLSQRSVGRLAGGRGEVGRRSSTGPTRRLPS